MSNRKTLGINMHTQTYTQNTIRHQLSSNNWRQRRTEHRFMWNRNGTKNVKKHNRNTYTTKQMSNIDPTTKPEVKSLFIRHSPVKVFAVIEERKHLRKK